MHTTWMHTHTHTHTQTCTRMRAPTHTHTHSQSWFFFNCMHIKDPVAHVRVRWIWWETLEWKIGLLQNPPPKKTHTSETRLTASILKQERGCSSGAALQLDYRYICFHGNRGQAFVGVHVGMERCTLFDCLTLVWLKVALTVIGTYHQPEFRNSFQGKTHMLTCCLYDDSVFMLFLRVKRVRSVRNSVCLYLMLIVFNFSLHSWENVQCVNLRSLFCYLLSV